MNELWQLYDDDGQPLAGKGAPKADVVTKGLLHGASHVWIWRERSGKREVLVQKRAAHKHTWPNFFDISAAGHIDLGEDPIVAAVRETHEELGIMVEHTQLQLLGVHRAYLTSGDVIENEFQWLYLLRQTQDVRLTPQTNELAGVQWVLFDVFRSDCLGDNYVPHGPGYYEKVTAAIDAARQM